MDKAACRKRCLRQLKNGGRSSGRFSDKRVLTTLEKLLRSLGAKSVLFYLPMEFECDVRPLLKRLRRRHRIYVPFMEDVSFKMVPYRLPLRKYKFDISQSGNSLFTHFKIDAAVVPVVGIDDNFRRVGFGKGMYDRFFEGLGYRPSILFVQPTLCRCPGIVTEAHDIDGDYLITPRTLFFKRKKGKRYVNRNDRRRHLDCRRHLLHYPKNRSG
jgi:5-formyltetrahydrofolate cyclo-ligase